MNCDVCDCSEHTTEECPELGLISQRDGVLQNTRARLTLPHSLQAVDLSDEVGVFACQKIPVKTQFGPYEAKKTTHEFNDNTLFVLKITTSDGTSVSLDTTSENECNWLCLVRVADSELEKNCIAYQLGTSIYYNTTKDIDIGSELKVWYAPAYAKRIGKTPYPDGTLRIMLGMKVIYPSVEDLPDVQEFQNPEKTEEEISPVDEEDNEDKVKDKPFACKRCSEKFSSESKLAIHIRQHILPGYQEIIRPVRPKRKRGRPPKSSKVISEKVAAEELETSYDDFSNEIETNSEPEVIDKKDNTFVPIGGHVMVSGRRVQPRRSLKGRRTTGFINDSDYVDLAQRVSLDSKAVVAEEDTESRVMKESDPTHPEKQGRGRPRKHPLDSKTKNITLTSVLDNSSFADSGAQNNSVFICKRTEGDMHSEVTGRIDVINNLQTAISPANNGLQKDVSEVMLSILDKVEDSIHTKSTSTKSTNTDIDECDEELEQQKLDGDLIKTKTMEEDITSLGGDEETSKEKLDADMQTNLMDFKSKKINKPPGRKKIGEDLREYEKEIHEGGKTMYVCGFCNKRFVHRRYLRMHLPGHTDRYRCADCGMKYVRPENLKRHQCKGSIDKEKNAESLESMHVSDVTELSVEKPALKYVCDICSQDFVSEKYLFRHMAIHSDLFKCNACRKTFSRKDSLQRHILKCCPGMAEQYGINYCSKCWKTFATVLGRDNHFINCTKAYCSECHKVYDSEEHLTAHECTGDSDQGTRHYYKCDKCNKSFLNLSYFEIHKTMHDLGGDHDCALCSKKLPSKEKKEEHEKICFAFSVIKRLGKVTCDDCGDEFSCIKKFREHTMKHFRPHQCELCGKSFVKVGSLHNHVCLETSEEPKHQCEICSKMFHTVIQLYKHRSEVHGLVSLECKVCETKFADEKEFLNHTCELIGELQLGSDDSFKKGNRSQKFMCHICGKCLVSRSNLNSHMKLHGEKNFVCPICEKRFHCMDYLKIHIAGFHEKRYRFVCPKCGKVLTSKPGLTNHIKLFHSSVKNVYPCPKCGKQFSQKGNMKTHLYSHTSEKSFVCPFCSKQFKYPDQLNRHKLIHTMQNKLRCEQCDKEFVKSYELRKHQSLVHSGMMYVCEFCGARCGHKHTVMRHYRRKHSAHVHLVQDPSYINKLFQQVYDDPKDSTANVDKEEEVMDGNSIVISGSHLVKMEPLFIQEGEIAAVDPQVVETLQGISAEDCVINTQSSTSESGAIIVNHDGTFTVPSENPYSLQTVQHVIDGKDGEKKTVLILQVVNNSEDQEMQQIQIHQLSDGYTPNEKIQIVSQSTAGGEEVGSDLSDHQNIVSTNEGIMQQSVSDIVADAAISTEGIQMVSDVVYTSVENVEGQVSSQQEQVQVLSLEDLAHVGEMGGIKNHDIISLDSSQPGNDVPQQIIVRYEDALANVDQFVSVSELIKDGSK